MIEFTLACDQCGTIIVASKKSAADARLRARLYQSAGRRGHRDLCCDCLLSALAEAQPHD